ncbi:hypothetical protein THAOC_28101, partial [Thalassiosira oceanica]
PPAAEGDGPAGQKLCSLRLRLRPRRLSAPPAPAPTAQFLRGTPSCGRAEMPAVRSKCPIGLRSGPLESPRPGDHGTGLRTAREGQQSGQSSKFGFGLRQKGPFVGKTLPAADPRSCPCRAARCRRIRTKSSFPESSRRALQVTADRRIQVHGSPGGSWRREDEERGCDVSRDSRNRRLDEHHEEEVSSKKKSLARKVVTTFRLSDSHRLEAHARGGRSGINDNSDTVPRPRSGRGRPRAREGPGP